MIVNSVVDLAWYVPAGMMSEDPAPEDFSKGDGLPGDILGFVFLISPENSVAVPASHAFFSQDVSHDIYPVAYG